MAAIVIQRQRRQNCSMLREGLSQTGPCARHASSSSFGSKVTPIRGVNRTATIQETMRETAMTTKRVKVNSPALLLLNATGMKPATVTSVPVSIGKAVDV